MTILEYIKKSIEVLSEFEGINGIRYGVSKLTGAYIIETIKTNALNTEAFLLAEIKIVDEFELIFPTNELIFITENDIISLDTVSDNIIYS